MKDRSTRHVWFLVGHCPTVGFCERQVNLSGCQRQWRIGVVYIVSFVIIIVAILVQNHSGTTAGIILSFL